MAKPSRGAKRAARKLLSPFERRFIAATATAVEQALHREMLDLRESIQADIATMVELGYELQRSIDRLESLESRLLDDGAQKELRS